QNVETDVDELEDLLHEIQQFDPPGIGARNLKECLLIQLDRRWEEDDPDPAVEMAKAILSICFEEFTKKHYDKIIKKLNIEDEVLMKDAIHLITKLNPKPGGVSGGMAKTQYLIPDFILTN